MKKTRKPYCKKALYFGSKILLFVVSPQCVIFVYLMLQTTEANT